MKIKQREEREVWKKCKRKVIGKKKVGPARDRTQRRDSCYSKTAWGGHCNRIQPPGSFIPWEVLCGLACCCISYE